MNNESRVGGWAAVAMSLTTIMAFAIGMSLVRLGNAVTTTDLPGMSATQKSLLLSAEMLKILIGLSILVLVVAMQRKLPDGIAAHVASVAGLFGAAFMLIAGGIGYVALSPTTAQTFVVENGNEGYEHLYAGIIQGLARTSLFCTGTWILITSVILFQRETFSHFPFLLGIGYGCASTLALLWQVFAFLSFVLGVPWTILVARMFFRSVHR